MDSLQKNASEGLDIDHKDRVRVEEKVRLDEKKPWRSKRRTMHILVGRVKSI
jgi:hypothetical protein